MEEEKKEEVRTCDNNCYELNSACEDVNTKENGRVEQRKPTAMEKKINTAIKSVVRTTGSTVGREISKSLTSAIFGNKSNAATRIAGNLGSSLGRNILGTLLKG